MNRFWSMVRKSYVALLVGLSAVSFILLFFIAVWMCIDVLGRAIFGHPIPGTPELVKSLIPAIVFLSLAYTLRKRRHVKVEIITQKLPPLAREVFNLVSNFFGGMVFFIITWFSWAPAWAGWLIREYEGVQLKVPVYPVRFISVFGSALLCLQFLLNMFDNIRAMFSQKRGAD